ncbi:hypothetical protein BH10ACI2_BH10ACI2_02990 [soil metagenome]
MADTPYPRNKIKILLLENISDSAVEELPGSTRTLKISPVHSEGVHDLTIQM